MPISSNILFQTYFWFNPKIFAKKFESDFGGYNKVNAGYEYRRITCLQTQVDVT